MTVPRLEERVGTLTEVLFESTMVVAKQPRVAMGVRSVVRGSTLGRIWYVFFRGAVLLRSFVSMKSSMNSVHRTSLSTTDKITLV